MMEETPQKKKVVIRTLPSPLDSRTTGPEPGLTRSFLDYVTGFDGYQLCRSRTHVFSGSFYTWTSSWVHVPGGGFGSGSGFPPTTRPGEILLLLLWI